MLYINTYKLLPPQDVAPKLNTHYYVLFSLILESCHISILFFPYNDFPVFIYPVSSSTLRGSGCEATSGSPKNLQARFAPCGF